MQDGELEAGQGEVLSDDAAAGAPILKGIWTD